MLRGLVASSLGMATGLAFHVFDGFPNIRLDVTQNLLWAAIGLFFYLAVHGYFLVRHAQTVGKRLLRLQVVNYGDGVPTTAAKIILLRVLPVTLVAQIPMVGPYLSMLDSLFIFGQSHRCVHDFIAGTKVVKLPPSTA